MSPRERVLLLIIGGAVVLGLGYQGVNQFFIQKIGNTRASITQLKAEKAGIQQILDSQEALSRRWVDYAGRTFSFDGTEAQSAFGLALKQIARDHGFENAVFSSAGGTKIGTATDIATVAHRISVEGRYEEVQALLRDLYKTPFLCQIIKLNIVPLGARTSRDVVKCEFIIESPLLPVLDEKKAPIYARGAATLATAETPPADPARRFTRADEYFRLFDERNIFRSYLAPPQNVVLIDNQDRKMVALKARFFWENRISQELVETIRGRSSLSLKGPGDVVEITGTYADGVTFGPKRLTLEAGPQGKDQGWTYVVSAHSPPTIVELEVKNESGGTAYVVPVVTNDDNEQKTDPTLAFLADGVTDLGVYENVKNVKLTVSYPSGKRGATKTFLPQEGRQTLVIGPEPVEPPEPEEVVIPDVPDDPPDANLAVTGLVYYPDPDEKNLLVQEMIATAADGARTIIRVGQTDAVDGGTLVAVVPALGGIVRMTKTGNYYIYPLGRKYTGRHKLEARSERDLPTAIDLWTSR